MFLTCYKDAGMAMFASLVPNRVNGPLVAQLLCGGHVYICKRLSLL